jgi:hypothetical protein
MIFEELFKFADDLTKFQLFNKTIFISDGVQLSIRFSKLFENGSEVFIRDDQSVKKHIFVTPESAVGADSCASKYFQ